MTQIQGYEFPEQLLYDVENQLWYAPLPDGTLRVGFTAWAAAQMGDVLVFTPKRIGHGFEKNRWLAMVEAGKWIGSARAAFDGTIVAHNQMLIDRPRLLTTDAYGEGWMMIVRPAGGDWSAGLVTGGDVGEAIERWIASGAYKDQPG